MVCSVSVSYHTCIVPLLYCYYYYYYYYYCYYYYYY